MARVLADTTPAWRRHVPEQGQRTTTWGPADGGRPDWELPNNRMKLPALASQAGSGCSLTGADMMQPARMVGIGTGHDGVQPRDNERDVGRPIGVLDRVGSDLGTDKRLRWPSRIW